MHQSFHHTGTHLHPGFNWQGITRVVLIVQCACIFWLQLNWTLNLSIYQYLSVSITFKHFLSLHTLCVSLFVFWVFFFYSVFRTKTVLFLVKNYFKQKSCFVRIMTKKQYWILKFKSVHPWRRVHLFNKVPKKSVAFIRVMMKPRKQQAKRLHEKNVAEREHSKQFQTAQRFAEGLIW